MRDRVIAEEMYRLDQILVFTDAGNQYTEIAREPDGHGGNSSRLDHQEQSPSVKKSPEWRECLAQVDVLPAGFRHHRGQLAVAQRANYRQQAGHDPNDQQPTRRPDLL